ncbi:MAG TPA: hypothetical protein VIY48_22195, partial [Candidatus Paceibacterota bacterium]
MKLLRGIFSLIYAQFGQAESLAFDRILHYLGTIDPSSETADGVADALYNILVSEYDVKMSSTQFKALVFDQTTKIYKKYAETDISLARSSFNLQDARAMKYLDDSANVYLGKYITSPELKERVVAFIKKKYFVDGQAIGNNKKALDEFIAAFKDELNLSHSKVRQIIDTTASRARTFGQINGMRSAAVKTFEIVGPDDSLTCGFCEDMIGRVFTASVAISRLDEIVASGPASIPIQAPFLKGSMALADVQNSSDEDLEAAGFGPPPY